MMPRRQRVLVMIATSSILITLLFPFWAQRLLAPPLDEPIAISPPGYVEKEINIPLGDMYGIELCFDTTGISLEKSKEILGTGGQQISAQGKPITVRWDLYALPDNHRVLGEEVVTHNISGFSPGKVWRTVGRVMYGPGQPLEPGRYRFSARVIDSGSDFANFPTRIQITTPSDAGFSWQKHLIAWYRFLKPVIWFLNLVLVFLVISHWRKHVKKL